MPPAKKAFATPAHMSSQITDAMFDENTVDSVCGPPKKKKSASGKPRPPARPYKRVDGATLQARLAEMLKRVTTLRAKVVILEDRLGAHQQEANLRIEEAA